MYIALFTKEQCRNVDIVPKHWESAYSCSGAYLDDFTHGIRELYHDMHKLKWSLDQSEQSMRSTHILI